MAKAARRIAGISASFSADSSHFGRWERPPSSEALSRVSCDLDDHLTLVTDPPVTDPVSTRADLLATIQEQIVPRLMAAHLSEVSGQAPCADARIPPTHAELAELSRIAVAGDLAGALVFVESLLREGLSMETVLLQLIAGAARLLGDDWMEDLRGFMEVTRALGTLQQVVNVLGPRFASARVPCGSVVLVSASSDQHTLGIHVLGELLRRAGWGVQVEPLMSNADLILLVQSVRVDIVGISLTSAVLVAPLARLVRAIKAASMNVDIAIMIGGPTARPDHAAEVGATFCVDARDAVRWLEHHVSVRGKVSIS